MQDLSLVTDTLTGFISAAILASPAYTGAGAPTRPTVTAQHPDEPSAAETRLNLYLFHIAADAHQVNNFWTQSSQGGPGQPIAFEPLALDLWYMLSAESATSYNQEQLALGVAMQGLHEHGTFALPGTANPAPHPGAPGTASLVLESPSFDEMSRLWQALQLPLRATAQYRVSVVLLDGREPPADAPPVQAAALTVAPTGAAPGGGDPHLVGTRRTVTYTSPVAPAQFTQSPAATAPAPTGVTGQEVSLDGTGLAATDRIVLVAYGPGGMTETDITSGWRVGGGPPGDRLRLRAPEDAAVPPGHYEVTVTRPGFRADPVPLDVAAWVDPGAGPEVHAAAGLYTLSVRNVPSDDAELRLGAVLLDRIADGDGPDEGQWQHNANAVTFRVPDGTPAGTHQIGLRVSGVESDPARWAVV